MKNIIVRDEYKLNIDHSMRLVIMIVSSFIMLLVVASSLYWYINSQNDIIVDFLKSRGYSDAEIKNELINNAARLKVMLIIFPNFTILAFYGWLVLRGRKIKYGYGFSIGWAIFFVCNGISSFWYSFQKIDFFIILTSLSNFAMFSLLIHFTFKIKKHRDKKRFEFSRKYQ